MVPAQVNAKWARKGCSVVLVMTNGGSDSVIGSVSVEGGGSVAELTVSLLRTEEIGRDCSRDGVCQEETTWREHHM